jgi:hypothetical protein
MRIWSINVPSGGVPPLGIPAAEQAAQQAGTREGQVESEPVDLAHQREVQTPPLVAPRSTSRPG